MRSIRLSLVVYFVLLEAAALAAAFLVVYYTAADRVKAAHDASRRQLNVRYARYYEYAQLRLDDQLLAQARTLAELTVQQLRGPDKAALISLGLLTGALDSQAHMPVVAWVSYLDDKTPLHAFASRRLTPLRQTPVEIRISEESLPREPDRLTSHEFYQIDCEWGSSWRSHSLGNRVLPFDPKQFRVVDAPEILFDDEPELPKDRKWRRVKYVFRPTQIRVPFRINAERRDFATISPWIIVQCVSSIEKCKSAIDRLEGEQKQQLERLEADAEDSLVTLQARLWWLGFLAFAASAIGGSAIVNVGLKPLHRVTEAVSRVSPRDFQLPLGDEGLPTELGPIVERLRGTLDELGRAFDREKQASADISHELRTPVAALLATLDVALRKPRTADEYRATLTSARAIGAQMRQLVERLLTLAKLDVGAARVKHTRLDVGRLIDECESLIGPLAAEQNLILTAECPANLHWVSDHDKLREMVVNLLHNAVQYNRPGGSVAVVAAVAGDELEIAVSDTGIGIKPEDLPHIFERFYRTDPSREASELNAGLGLSIVRGYAELLGGRVSVTSQAGEGTTFRIRLPRREPAEHGKEAA